MAGGSATQKKAATGNVVHATTGAPLYALAHAAVAVTGIDGRCSDAEPNLAAQTSTLVTSHGFTLHLANSA